MTRAYPIRNAVVLLTMLLLSTANPGHAQQPKQCSLLQFAGLDMDTLPDGTFSVPLKVNDQSVQMEVDTGSVQSSLTEEMASELGIKWGAPFSNGAFVNGVAPTGRAQAQSITIGPLHSDGAFNILVIPNQLTQATDAGLLAPDIMRQYDIELDFYHGKFNIFSANQCDGHVVYWTGGGYAALPITRNFGRKIYVDAKLDGKMVNVIFDTGSEKSIMSLEKARAIFGMGDKNDGLKFIGNLAINGGPLVPSYSYPFESLDFDGVKILHPQIDLIPQKNLFYESSFNTEVVIGMGILRQMRIYIAYNDNMLYLTGAEAH